VLNSFPDARVLATASSNSLFHVRRRRGVRDELKYLCFTECSPEDWNTALERDKILQAERAMYPEKYPKYAITSCVLSTELPKLTEGLRAVDVYEVDSPEQLANHMAFWDAQKLDVKSFRKWYIPLVDFVEPYTTEFHRQRELQEKRKEQSRTSR